LRSSLTISITRQEIQYVKGAAATLGNLQTAPPVPYTLAQNHQPFQQIAGNSGPTTMPGAPGWQDLALANGIENPRLITPGALVNVFAAPSVSASAQLGITPQTSGPLSLTLGTSGGASGGVSLGFVSTTSSNSGGSFGVQANASFSVGS
jgi:hypothetical protein